MSARVRLGVPSIALAVLSACASTPRLVGARRATVDHRGDFVVVPLGVEGGLDESNLSAYLLAVRGDDRWVALDAGTLYAGLRAALARGAFGDAPVAGAQASYRDVRAALTRRVRAVLVSHPHFDHVAGLVLNAPDDAPRSIYASARTLDALRDHVFAQPVWANFLDEGAAPRVGRYHPVRLAYGEPRDVSDTPFRVTAYPLAHAGDEASTAFLVESAQGSVLYLGDTGPDAVEHTQRLADLWRTVAPRVRAHTLRAVFLECSYADPRPEGQLFGHLTPRWVRAELDALAEQAQGLEGLTVVVTHVKPGESDGVPARARVRAQLGDAYRGARFVWPEQGVAFGL